MEDTPFAEAERVFEHVLDLMEQAIEAKYPGAGALQYHFHWMGDLAEYRRIGATFRDAQDRSREAVFHLPGSTAFTSHTRERLLSSELQLTSQDYALFLDLVHLGGCIGCWKVDGLMSKKANAEVYGPGITLGPLPIQRYTYITPLAILAAFAGGTLEEAWPDRRFHIETAWYLWQARHAEVRVAETPDVFPEDLDAPSYL
jgi:hypothetical protein